MGATCTSFGDASASANYESNNKTINGPSLTPEEMALVSENFRALCKNALEIGLLCEEKILKNVPEATHILQTGNSDHSHRHALMGQGVVLLKGIGLFVAAANDPDKLKVHVERLASKHGEKYSLKAERLAETMQYIEEVFLQQAATYCTSHNREETMKAWRRLFRDVKILFSYTGRPVATSMGFALNGNI